MARLFWLMLFVCLICGCNTNSTAAQSIDAVIKVGISKSEFARLVIRLRGKDITPGLAIVGPKGKHPVYGIVWEFADYEAIISVSFKRQVLTNLDYCSKDDFGVSKSHRAKSTVEISQITFNSDKTTTRTAFTRTSEK